MYHYWRHNEIYIIHEHIQLGCWRQVTAEQTLTKCDFTLMYKYRSGYLVIIYLYRHNATIALRDKEQSMVERRELSS